MLNRLREVYAGSFDFTPKETPLNAPEMIWIPQTINRTQAREQQRIYIKCMKRLIPIEQDFLEFIKYNPYEYKIGYNEYLMDYISMCRVIRKDYDSRTLILNEHYFEQMYKIE